MRMCGSPSLVCDERDAAHVDRGDDALAVVHHRGELADVHRLVELDRHLDSAAAVSCRPITRPVKGLPR